MTSQKKQSTEAAVREIRRRTRRKFSPEEKIRIVLEGLRRVSQARAVLGHELGLARAEHRGSQPVVRKVSAFIASPPAHKAVPEALLSRQTLVFLLWISLHRPPHGVQKGFLDAAAESLPTGVCPVFLNRLPGIFKASDVPEHSYLIAADLLKHGTISSVVEPLEQLCERDEVVERGVAVLEGGAHSSTSRASLA